MVITTRQVRQVVEGVGQSLGFPFIPCGGPTRAEAPTGSTTALLLMAGTWDGAAIVSCSDELARTLASRLFAVPEAQIGPADIDDAVSELANMIVGNLKGMVVGDCQMLPPVIVHGGLDAVRLPWCKGSIATAFDGGGCRLVVTLHDRSAIAAPAGNLNSGRAAGSAQRDADGAHVSGSLQAVPFGEIVQLLGLANKTGILTVECALARKQVAFDDGSPVYCSAGGVKEYLAHHLLARTSLTMTDVDEALRTHERTGKRLGEILVASGKITEDVLEKALRRKIEDSLCDLFTWKAGRFAFEERPLTDEIVPFKFPWAWREMVMEGTRRLDEWGRLRESIPNMRVRMRPDTERLASWTPRNKGEQRLVELAAKGLRVQEVCDAFHTSDFEIVRHMATFVAQGLLVVDEASLAAPDSTSLEIVLRRAREAMERGLHGRCLDIIREAARRFGDHEDLGNVVRELRMTLREAVTTSWGGEDAIAAIVAPLDKLDPATLTTKESFVLSRIVARWSIRSILRVCPFDELDVLVALDSLARNGVIELGVGAESPVAATA